MREDRWFVSVFEALFQLKPIAAPVVGGMITSTIHVLILVPVFFAMMKERSLRRGTLHQRNE